MALDNGNGDPIKVEVVNFDNIRDNTVKVVVAALAATVITTIVEEAMKAHFAKKRAKKKQTDFTN